MKALVCELCGGNDFAKQDGFFVCQHCGTKYSLEEAKKMMIEGTVEVQGTVKIDNSELIKMNLANARRAKEKEDWEETEKYYNLVEQYDPSNIEAIFYSAYGKAKTSLVDADLYKRQSAFKVLSNCVSLIDDHFTIAKEKEEWEIIQKISADIFKMAASTYVYNQRKNGYGMVIKTDRIQTVTLFNNLGIEFCNALEHIIAKYPSGDNRVIKYYQLELRHVEYVLKNGSLANPSILQNRAMEIHRAWNRVEASHEIPNEKPAAGAKQSGCYVATAVYGSYDCPQVWTLRRYRDFTLAETWYGRAFISIYYAISPTLVKWFGNTKWFKNMWKPKLDKMVCRLNNKGVPGTPYHDRKW